MDIEAISRWLGALAFALTIINTLWLWISLPGREAKQRHEGLKDNLKEHDRRIQAVESELRHLPTREGVHELETALARLETELETMGNTLRRIDDFLRSSK